MAVHFSSGRRPLKCTYRTPPSEKKKRKEKRRKKRAKDDRQEWTRKWEEEWEEKKTIFKNKKRDRSIKRS